MATTSGRNLVAKTNRFWQVDKNTTTGVNLNCFLVSGLDVNGLQGRTLTLSAWRCCPGTYETIDGVPTWAVNRFGPQVTLRWTDGDGVESTTYPTAPYAFLNDSNRTAGWVSMTFTIPVREGYTLTNLQAQYYIWARPASDNDEVWEAGYLKLEFGEEATAYRPAPEDLSVSSEVVLGCANATVSTIRDLQSCTRYYLLQSSTATAPSKPTANPPGGSWATSEPGYTAGSTNSLYFCDLNVFTDGDYAYSDVSLSSSYEAAKAAYNKAQVAQDAASAAQSDIDGLAIGGRNLARGTSDEWSDWYEPTERLNWTRVLAYAYLPEEKAAGDPYACSIEIEWSGVTASDQGAFRISFQGAVDGVWTMTNPWTNNTFGWSVTTIPSDGVVRYTGVATLNANAVNASKCECGIRCDWWAGGKFRVRRVKVEKGNRCTDWTPAPEDVTSAIEEVAGGVECIVGTQTGATNAWTGVAGFSSLKDGQVIHYWLPYAGTSAVATLNLTLSSGATTGEKAVYINATTRCTTHIAAGNMVQMVYRQNVSINGVTYTGWWICRALNDNTYDRIRFNNAIKSKSGIAASTLIVGDGAGYFQLRAGSVFDVDKPILWAASAIAANATGNNNYVSMPTCTLRNNAGSSWTGTQYATLYLAGTLVGSSFVVASSDWLTTSPSNESLTYISLGYMYSTYQMYLYPEHPMYRLVDGTLKAVSQMAYEAQVTASSAQSSADAARAEFQRVVRIDDDGLHVGDNQSIGEVLIDSESVNVVVNGSKYSKFAGEYVQFGDYQLRRTSDGGLAFKMKE